MCTVVMISLSTHWTTSLFILVLGITISTTWTSLGITPPPSRGGTESLGRMPSTMPTLKRWRSLGKSLSEHLLSAFLDCSWQLTLLLGSRTKHVTRLLGIGTLTTFKYSAGWELFCSTPKICKCGNKEIDTFKYSFHEEVLKAILPTSPKGFRKPRKC